MFANILISILISTLTFVHLSAYTNDNYGNYMLQNENNTPQNENMPKWKLTDLYNSQDEMNKDLEKLSQMADRFAEKFQGKIAKTKSLHSESSNLDNQVDEHSTSLLLDSIKAYEDIRSVAGKVGTYAYLSYSINQDSPEILSMFKNTSDSLRKFNTKLTFYELELSNIHDDSYNKYLQTPEISRYKNWLDGIRSAREYQLSLEEEKIIQIKEAASQDSVRLFDKIASKARYKIDGKDYNQHEIMHYMTNNNSEIRKKAYYAFANGLKQDAWLYTHITNTLAKNKYDEDMVLRKMPTPMTSMNLYNKIEDDVVETLATVVKNNYKNISQRYYKLKAQFLAQDKLEMWDRNAPLSTAKQYSFEEAKEIVLKSYETFSPKLVELANEFFNNSWIDAPAEDSKLGGAFAHPCVVSEHPFVMLNFKGSARDVSTLSHELGHGIHALLSKEQGDLMSNSPLTIAETASVFAEQLTFRYQLNQLDDPKQKKIMLASKIEDMINTVFRQIAFYEFEKKVHTERANGELSIEQMSDFWLTTQKEMLGDAFNYNDEYSFFWSYVPHFIHSPFYVYSYAFGDCFVNSLYKVYKSGKVPNFQEKYFEILSAGGSKDYKELLSIFNFNPYDKNFWQEGINLIDEMITEFESL